MMRIATVTWQDSSSAALIVDDTAAPIRALQGRETAFDAGQLIESPLTIDETSALRRGKRLPLGSTVLLPPIIHPPKNVLCVGKNYLEHVAEGARAEGSTNTTPPSRPVWFTKAPTALIGSGAKVILDHAFTNALDYEGELAVIIGKIGKSIRADRALEHVFGYTILNDVTARDVQQAHLQWFRGKSADTYAPCGPWIVTADEFSVPLEVDLETRVNGEIRQRDNTRNLLFDIPTLIASISEAMTLFPGDIIATGTPSGVAWGMTQPRFLAPGDNIDINISGIGTLRNTVVAAHQ